MAEEQSSDDGARSVGPVKSTNIWDVLSSVENKEQQKKQEQEAYKVKLAAMDDDALRKEANQFIWLSAYANNNPRSAYHWMCDYVYDECSRRGKVNIYSEEHAKLSKEAGR